MITRLLFSLFLLVLSNTIMAQTDLEIGTVYIDRAEQHYLDNNIEEAIQDFDKAMRYIKEIKDSRIARIGTLLSYKLKDYSKAKVLVKRYFDLKPEKDTETYDEMLKIYVGIDEALEARAIQEKKEYEERLRKEREKRFLDSLTVVWTTKSERFLIKADSIGELNAFNLAVFKRSGKVGLMNDKGSVLVDADTYNHVLNFDGYYIFMNHTDRPTRLLCYNATKNDLFQLPNVSEFNSNVYDYGKLMLPRANGLLVSYPNDHDNIIVYDLIAKSFKDQIIDKDFLKSLKKKDIIERFDNDFKIRIDKTWYSLGTTLGGGFYPLFDEQQKLVSFINTANGRRYDTAYFSYFGPFYNGKFQIVENGKNTFWMDLDGIKYEQTNSEHGVYGGLSRFEKVDEAHYRIIVTKNGHEVFIKEDEVLPKLKDFLMINKE